MARNYLTTLKPYRTIEQRLDAQPSYEFRMERGWHWLQRLCFAVLKWIGAERLLTYEKITYGPLDGDTLKQQVFNAINLSMRWDTYDPDKFAVMLGRDKFRELVSDKELSEALRWTLPLEIKEQYPYYHGWLFHVPIIAVPWLEGMALVPTQVPKR